MSMLLFKFSKQKLYVIEEKECTYKSLPMILLKYMVEYYFYLKYFYKILKNNLIFPLNLICSNLTYLIKQDLCFIRI